MPDPDATLPVLGSIVSIQRGPVAPIADGRLSAIVKRPLDAPVLVTERGIEGDEQADLAHHGGPEKAVYGYPVAHYAAWQASHPQHTARLVPGGFGENLTVAGADEDSLCLGDVVAAGGVQLCACQPRQPCATLAAYFADRTIGREMTRTGRSGWYFRVVRGGRMAAGDTLHLVARPNPQWSFARFLGNLRDKRFSDAELAELATLPGLAAQWRRDAARTLAQRKARVPA